MRICIELRRDVNANVILNQLYKHTQLQDTFGVIMLALVNNEPKILNLHDMLQYYLDHQKDVVTRRTKYELNKAEERAHILEGLLIALDHIDEVIQIIRNSENVSGRKGQTNGALRPERRSGSGYCGHASAGSDRSGKRANWRAEYKELQERIAELKAILADEKRLLSVIKEEISVDFRKIRG